MKKKTKKELKEEYNKNRKLIPIDYENLEEADWFNNTTIEEAKELMLKRFEVLSKKSCITQKIKLEYSPSDGFQFFSICYYRYETFLEFEKRYIYEYEKELKKYNNAENILNGMLDTLTYEFKRILLHHLSKGV